MRYCSCKNYRLANFFPARAVAVGLVYNVLRQRGLKIEENPADWIDHLTGGKVDVRDFEEVVEELRKLE